LQQIQDKLFWDSRARSQPLQLEVHPRRIHPPLELDCCRCALPDAIYYFPCPNPTPT
jgi:hypothetical protein